VRIAAGKVLLLRRVLWWLARSGALAPASQPSSPVSHGSPAELAVVSGELAAEYEVSSLAPLLAADPPALDGTLVFLLSLDFVFPFGRYLMMYFSPLFDLIGCVRYS
jgi:hypothetical protein